MIEEKLFKLVEYKVKLYLIKIMKKIYLFFISYMIVLIVMAVMLSCDYSKSPVEREDTSDTVFVYVNDTIYLDSIVTDYEWRLDSIHVELEKTNLRNEELKYINDSLMTINDILYDEVTIANIKLARIKEYNRIAANGNNIKFLRGWINRVLDN